MARHRGQKALYEVITKGKARPVGLNGNHVPAAAQQQEAAQVQAQGLVSEPAVQDPAPAQPVSPGPPVRWHRPRPIQFNDGRLELTIPYPIAIAVVLAFILVVLAAFRLGQHSG